MSGQHSGLQSTIEHENEFWDNVFEQELKKNKNETKSFSSVWWKNYYHEMVGYAQSILKKYTEPHVLEAGSGSGKASILLGADVRRIFLDISPAALKYAKHLAGVFSATNIDFVEGNIFAMPFANSKFDFTWNIGVLEHYSEKEIAAIVEEMLRVTKPGGTLAIAVPNFISSPIIKARFLKLPFLRWLPGYRLDSERSYGLKALSNIIIEVSAHSEKKLVVKEVKRFGSFLPMETPGWLLNTIGKLIDTLFPRGKFLLFITCDVR